MKLSRQLFAATLVFIFASLCFSQAKWEKKSDKKKEEKISKKFRNALEIKANVFISDASRKPLDDVKIDDLKIYEDGIEQKITYFAKKEDALNLGFVIDNTGSLRPQEKIVAAIGAALTRDLRPVDEAFIVRFVSSDKVEMVQDWTADKKLLDEALKNLYTEGGQSAIIDAVYLTAEKILEREKSDKKTRRALVLITDGDERDSYHKLDETLALFDKTDVQIFVFALQKELSKDSGGEFTKYRNPREEAAKFVQTLALETGGAAYIFDKKYTIEQLNAALKSIGTELGSQYVIGYTSTNQKRDGSTRKLSVKIADGAAGEKRQGIVRESFDVPAR